jgi:hypothetical protein
MRTARPVVLVLRIAYGVARVGLLDRSIERAFGRLSGARNH